MWFTCEYKMLKSTLCLSLKAIKSFNYFSPLVFTTVFLCREFIKCNVPSGSLNLIIFTRSLKMYDMIRSCFIFYAHQKEYFIERQTIVFDPFKTPDVEMYHKERNVMTKQIYPKAYVFTIQVIYTKKSKKSHQS